MRCLHDPFDLVLSSIQTFKVKDAMANSTPETQCAVTSPPRTTIQNVKMAGRPNTRCESLVIFDSSLPFYY